MQKHRATALHYDFRLEAGGTLRSWAVPKGPSLDPKQRRLAMEVEDHPIEYNAFEGTIPKGQYGGGTVMLWDRGTYEPEQRGEEDDEDILRAGYDRGDLKFILHGKRLKGSWVLVRMRRDSERPQWLLIKHRDAFADPTYDVVAEANTSVATRRTMEQIASGRSRVWQSDRDESAEKPVRNASLAKRATRTLKGRKPAPVPAKKTASKRRAAATRR